MATATTKGGGEDNLRDLLIVSSSSEGEFVVGLMTEIYKKYR